jgi:hypothetical protein
LEELAMKKPNSFFLIAASAVLACGCTKAKPTLVALQQAQIAPPPQTVSVTMTGYTPAPGDKFTNLFVSNFSVKANQGQLSLMTARDGLPDTVKTAANPTYGFTTLEPESVVPDFPDLMLYLAGITTVSQSTLNCASGLDINTSHDGFSYTDPRTGSTEFLGLRDCDKLYVGLNPALFDFDGDGIPDYLEIRNGLNPANPNDANLSIAGDGVTNLDKIKQGIPVDENALSQPNQLFALKYKVTNQADGSILFNVTNIPVLNGGQDNFLAFYLTETNTTSHTTYLFTAYSILKAGTAGQTFVFPFWGTPTNMSNYVGNFNVGINF